MRVFLPRAAHTEAAIAQAWNLFCNGFHNPKRDNL